MRSPKERAVVLLAFGRRGYGLAASNLAATIRYHGYRGRIVVHAAGPALDALNKAHRSDVEIVQLPVDGDPALVKLLLPQLLEQDSLVVDVDTVCLQDLSPFFDALQADGRPFITHVPGKGRPGESIAYFQWAKHTTIQEKHALADHATLYAVQSSWMYIRPNEQTQKISHTAIDAYDRWEVQDLKHKWGGGKPDELFWGIACTLLEYDPTWSGEPMHYASGSQRLPEIAEKHVFLTLPGQAQGIGKRFVDMYDATMRTVLGQDRAKSHEILQHKHANFKTQTNGLRKLQKA